MIGSVEEIREVVEPYAAAGVDELIIADYNLGLKAQRIATMDTFIKEVVGGVNPPGRSSPHTLRRPVRGRRTYPWGVGRSA